MTHDDIVEKDVQKDPSHQGKQRHAQNSGNLIDPDREGGLIFKSAGSPITKWLKHFAQAAGGWVTHTYTRCRDEYRLPY